MSSRIVVLLLCTAVMLTGCTSNSRKTGSAKIGMNNKHVVAKQPRYRYPSRSNGQFIHNPAYDPFFDRRNHQVREKQERGFPHADTPHFVDKTRDGFSYAPIYADRGLSYRLDTGDVVRIDVFEQANLSRLYRIDGGGFISMPLIGAVPVRGLSTAALEQEVAEKLRQSYIRDPKVTVEISTHRPFYILGEVRNSGQYPYVLGMTVETAVAVAGGYSPRANQRKVLIIRRIKGKLVRSNVPNSYQIKPGDTVKVIERFF